MSSDRGSRFPDDRIDAAIDRAVCEMLDVEPPAGLRGRVLDRIGERQSRAASASRRKIVWTAVPLALAAILTLAVLAPWRQDARQPEQAVPIAAAVQPSSRVPLPPPASRDTRRAPPARRPVVDAAHRRQPTARGDGRVAAAAFVPSEAAPGVEPLTPIAPITVPAVRPAQIEQRDVVVTPLSAIAEVQVAPLSPPDRRN